MEGTNVVNSLRVSWLHPKRQAMQTTMPRENEDDAMLYEGDEDIDDVPSDLEEVDNSSVGEEEAGADSDGNGSGDEISLAEGSDDDDLIAVDDMPDGLVQYDGPDADIEQDDEEWGGFCGGDKRKRKDNSQARRKKRKTLPTFATYEEYAKMIEEGPEDDVLM
jgi:ribosome biogenesis protein MAK21